MPDDIPVQIEVNPTAKGFILNCGEGVDINTLLQICYAVGSAIQSENVQKHIGDMMVSRAVYIKDESVIVNLVLAK